MLQSKRDRENHMQAANASRLISLRWSWILAAVMALGPCAGAAVMAWPLWGSLALVLLVGVAVLGWPLHRQHLWQYGFEQGRLVQSTPHKKKKGKYRKYKKHGARG